MILSRSESPDLAQDARTTLHGTRPGYQADVKPTLGGYCWSRFAFAAKMTDPPGSDRGRPTTRSRTDANACRTCDNPAEATQLPGRPPMPGISARSVETTDESEQDTSWPTAADRHLLFGWLALQNGLIDQGQLWRRFLQAWTRDKSKGLADHLEAYAATRPGAKKSLLYTCWPRFIWKRTVATWRRAWPPSPPTTPDLARPGQPSASRRSRPRSPGSLGLGN